MQVSHKRKRVNEYSAVDTPTKCKVINGFLKLFNDDNDAVFCLRALLSKYESIGIRGEPNDEEHKQAVQIARKRVLAEDLEGRLSVAKIFRKGILSKLKIICRQFALRFGAERVVVHKPRMKRSMWTHEFMKVSEADRRRFRHGQVTLATLKKRYFWEPCKVCSKIYPPIRCVCIIYMHILLHVHIQIHAHTCIVLVYQAAQPGNFVM